MRIVCIRHVPFEGPGAIRQWATKRGHTLTEARAQESLPSPDAFDMLVVLGGPMSVTDETGNPWLADEKALIARAVAGGKKVLGICLGAQLVAVAVGGRAYRNPEVEVGWFPVTKTGAGKTSAVFAGWPDSFMAGHWHADTFEPPADVPVAIISRACMRQAFEMNGGRVVALQFHLEWTEPGLKMLVDECGKDLIPGEHVQSGETILAHPQLLTETRRLLFDLLDRMAALE